MYRRWGDVWKGKIHWDEAWVDGVVGLVWMVVVRKGTVV